MASLVSITQGSSPNVIRLSAGEPLIFSYHNVKNGVPTSMSDRLPVFAIYGLGRVEVDYFDAAITTDERGPIAYFEIDGAKSEAWYGQNLKWELSERGSKGRGKIAGGVLTIDESAPRIDRLAGAPAGRYVARITRIDNPATSPAPSFDVSYADFGAAAVPAPSFTSNPTISGSAQVGSTLTGNDGTISGATTIARQWLRNGSAINGATATTYTLVSADEATQVALRVTATNSTGSTTATSAAQTVAAAPALPAPSWSIQPSISGTPAVGSTLNGADGSVSNGTVSGRQWVRDGVAISGATSTAYTLVSADAGKSITYRVTASGSGGSASATSSAVTVAVPAPVFTVAASISPSSGQVGTVFTGADGTISNGSVSARQWLLDGAVISGAAGGTYTSTAAGSLTYRVTATGAGGSATSTSSAATVSAAAAPAPAFTTAPSISPTSGKSGDTFTASDGAASNASSFARRWLLSGTAIGTGTTVTPNSTGNLMLEVTATGNGGSTVANSPTVTVSAPAAQPGSQRTSFTAAGLTPAMQYHPHTETSTADANGSLTGVAANATSPALTPSTTGPLEEVDLRGIKRWRFRGDQFLDLPASFEWDNRSFTVFMVGRAHASSATVHYFGAKFNGGGSVAANTLGSFLGLRNAGNPAPSYWPNIGNQNAVTVGVGADRNMIQSGHQLSVVGGCSRPAAYAEDGVTQPVRYWQNSKSITGPSAVQTIAAVDGKVLTGARIGGYLNANGTGNLFDLYEIVGFKGTLTNAQCAAVSAALMANHGVVDFTRNWVLEGDSITDGVSDVPKWASAGMVATEPGSGMVDGTWRVMKVAVSGAKVADMATRRDNSTGWTAAKIGTNPANNVLSALIGRNDTAAYYNANAGWTAQQVADAVFADIVAYMNDATNGVVARGWKPVQMTGISTGASGDARIGPLRNRILADFVSSVSGGKVVDIASVTLPDGTKPFMPGSQNTAYYQTGDVTHPSILGTYLMTTGSTTPANGYRAVVT